ncbi:MAG: HemK/PrmC family methyltransferase [bacterium]
MNIQTIYKKSIDDLRASKISTPELDAKILIENVLNISPTQFFAHPEMLITSKQSAQILKFIKRRSQGEPIAYILGNKEFYGYDFIVNKSTLIPRPESEWLVETALNCLKDRSAIPNSLHIIKEPEKMLPAFLDASISMLDNEMSGANFRRRLKRLSSQIFTHSQIPKSTFNILDLGTGSGALIISLIKELQKLYTPSDLNYFASDISPSALNIARKNTRLHNIKNIKFVQSDLFSNRLLHQKFDIIIANLPYVPDSDQDTPSTYPAGKINDLPTKSIDFEPASAIFADDNGASIIKRFLTQCPQYLADNALILIELDPRNANAIKKFAERFFQEAKIELQKDLAGHYRYLTIQKIKKP